MSNMAQTKTVFVIEDEALLLDAIEQKLKKSGYSVITAMSGQQVFDLMDSVENVPDLIWLDYYLQDMEGLAVLHKIKNSSAWQKIPVVIVSNSASQDKISGMLALGAKEYLVKAEHSLADIVTILEDFLQKETSSEREN